MKKVVVIILCLFLTGCGDIIIDKQVSEYNAFVDSAKIIQVILTIYLLI